MHYLYLFKGKVILILPPNCLETIQNGVKSDQVHHACTEVCYQIFRVWECIMRMKKHILWKKIVQKRTKEGVIENTVLGISTNWHSRKKKFSALRSVKKFMMTVLWNIKGTITIDFLLLSSQNLKSLIYIYIYIYVCVCVCVCVWCIQ